MSTGTSFSEKTKFTYPEYFAQSGSLDQWVCTICTPSGKGKKYMTLKAAQHHERHSSQHTQKVSEAEQRKWTHNQDPDAWDAPIRDGPWLTKGEMRKRENRLHVDLVRDMVPFWIRGVEAAERGKVLRLEDFLEKLESPTDWNGGYEFVEAVARQEAVDEERRRQMHKFFEMPTEGKVDKINQMIRVLRHFT